jgi:hypothetical protein
VTKAFLERKVLRGIALRRRQFAGRHRSFTSPNHLMMAVDAALTETVFLDEVLSDSGGTDGTENYSDRRECRRSFFTLR